MSTKLTQEEKRVKIAEAMGWKKCHAPGLRGLVVGKAPSGYIGNRTHYEIEPTGHWWELPDYFNDLNACHKAELFHGFNNYRNPTARDYFMRLLGMVSAIHQDEATSSATAAQRAEALGLTLNLWEVK
jgi:hypothetical protein